VLAVGLYSKEQSSTLYTVVTASGVVEVGWLQAEQQVDWLR